MSVAIFTSLSAVDDSRSSSATTSTGVLDIRAEQSVLHFGGLVRAERGELFRLRGLVVVVAVDFLVFGLSWLALAFSAGRS